MTARVVHKARKRHHRKQGGRCFWCDVEMLTYSKALGNLSLANLSTADHLIPRSKDGGDTPQNIVAACNRCNSARKNSTVAEWLARLPLYLKQAGNPEHLNTILQRLEKRGISLPSVNPEMAPIQPSKAACPPLKD